MNNAVEKRNDSQSKTVPIVSLAVFLITLFVNYGSMVGLFGNQTQEEISNKYRNFITLEPFTFSIWGIIYALVLVVLLYQFYLKSKNRYPKRVLDSVNTLFVVSCLLNIGWNITWVNDMIALSTILILLFTVVLGLINHLLLKSYGKKASIIIPLAFAIYFGWLTVATVTNVGAFLVKNNWSHFGVEEHLVTCIVYILVGLLATFIIFKIRNPLFNLPIIWAFVGIYFMLVNNPPSTPVHGGMRFVVLGVIVFLLVQSLIVFIKNGKKILPVK